MLYTEIQPIALAILTSIITGGFVLVFIEIGNRKNRNSDRHEQIMTTFMHKLSSFFRFEEVEITDEDSVIFSRVATNDVYTDGYLLNIVEVGVSGEENRKVYSLCSEDKSQMVIIPPTKFSPFEETPSLFLYYPI